LQLQAIRRRTGRHWADICPLRVRRGEGTGAAVQSRVQTGNSWSYRVRLILDLERVMSDQFTQTSRRQFFRGAGVAVGWTQHTTGVQTIREATTLQSLLGNIGRPGGGILALRGHASIQGSTDIPTLYNLLPGYLNAPNALKNHATLADYIETEISPTSYWYHFPKFVVSLLTAWFGAAATRENDYGFGWLPRNVGDHSHLPMFVAMSQGKIHGFMAMGQNPAVDGQNASLPRRALAKLDWLVVRDLYETETATFWIDSPEVKSGETKAEDIATEIFLLPAAATAE